MPTAKQLKDHSWVVQQLKQAQTDDENNREQAREALLFVAKRDGQWEPEVLQNQDSKPKYTIDLTSPTIDQIVGDLISKDFDIRVQPAGGKASRDGADLYDGLLRNIQRLSDANKVFSRATRGCVVKGFDCVEAIQEYVDDDSFDQDLLVSRVSNAEDRVWWSHHQEPDASDAEMCWKLTPITREEFEEKYPDENPTTLPLDRTSNAYFDRNDLIMIGQFYYFKEEKRELAKMSNGAVYDAEELEMVEDDLAQLGITVVARRERTRRTVCIREMSGEAWLGEPQETVFANWLPLVPLYANFEVIENHVVWYGKVEKLLDPQRVFNYSMSREVEEGALAPRAKYWMTREQAKGEGKTLATLNTNTDPVQFYTPDERAPGAPQQTGGAQINPGLRNISESMRQLIGQAAGMFAANMGDNPGLQSGIAIEQLQDRGDNGNVHFIEVRETMQRHLGRILVNAIPRVYEPSRQVRIIAEDGTEEMETLGELVRDEATGEVQVLNDLTNGIYDVSCYSGPSYRSRQNETVKNIVELGKVDPTLIALGGDILLSNIPTPGMSDIASRKRAQLFKEGLIPEDQFTDEERAQAEAAANQELPPDPNMLLAQAEQAKAEADMAEVQRKSQLDQQSFMLKQAEFQLRQAEMQSKQQREEMQAQLDAFRMRIDASAAENEKLKLQIELALAQAEIGTKNASAAKTLAEAEAQDMENDAIASGLTSFLESLGGQPTAEV